jgi:glycosyltransferase involved in cell wall biosynthesis
LASDAASRPLISVVITVRNEERCLAQLLESLFLQEPPFEVVLVDSESRDRTLEIAQSYGAKHPELRIFSQDGSRGIGRNRGVKEARGAWVAFTDGDCFADSNWLRELRRGLAKAPVAAGQTVVVGKPSYGALERVELFQSGYDVTYPSCNLAYHRDLFERLGGFDPRFITAEDIDLNLRAVRAGAAVEYVSEAVIYHHKRATFVRFLYQAFWNGYGRKQLTEKQGSLWGRYRMGRLLTGQRTPLALARLAAAFAGYATRMLTGGGSRLTPEATTPSSATGAAAQ